MPDTTVALRAARIPVIGFVAHHHWLEVMRGGGCDRWEVWQRADAGGDSWGHLHRNLLPPGQGVGNGPSWLVHTWQDEEAGEMAARIEASIAAYPWCHLYRYWPGPNSNTYVQWVLGGNLVLGRRAPGKWYASRVRDRHGEIA